MLWSSKAIVWFSLKQSISLYVFCVSMPKSQSNLYWNRCMSAIEPLVVTLAFILPSKFLLTPYEASVEEKLKAVWHTKDKLACTIAFIWMTSGVSQVDSKVIANWPSSCEGLLKLLLSSFSFHLQFYWLTEALISERKVKGLAFSQHMSVAWAYVSLWLCIFVSLHVRMFVPRANKVEDTMSWCLGTIEILASI